MAASAGGATTSHTDAAGQHGGSDEGTYEVTSTVSATVRRPELKDFLRNRRGRITPAEAGLPTGGRRRTPGLRREEVAVLAGVGPSWYQWLEQGRDIAVSPQVLDSVARVLRLDDTERRHLYSLAGLNPPLPQAAPDVAYCEGLQRLIEAWAPHPATMLDRYWNHVAWNESARLALGMPDADRNCLVGFFRHERFRQGEGRARSWERIAPTVVAAFRASAAERPDDTGFREVIDELLRTSAEFAELGSVRMSRSWAWSSTKYSIRSSASSASKAPSCGCRRGRI